jgi:hypothetical protein
MSIPSPTKFANPPPIKEHSLWTPAQTPAPLENTPVFYQWLIGRKPPKILQCEAIEEELRLVACSDRAYDKGDGISSHGWVFASQSLKTIQAEGAGPTDGHPALLSSYRGLLAENILNLSNR